MIRRFGAETALLVVDAQKGVNDVQHWGGANGRRNNPAAEANIAEMIDAFRNAALTVVFTAHDSRQAVSPLKLGTFRRNASRDRIATASDQQGRHHRLLYQFLCRIDGADGRQSWL